MEKKSQIESKNIWEFFRSTSFYEGLRLQRPPENIPCGLQTSSDYVTTSSDCMLYNDAKIMAYGLLEKIGHLFLKKLYPHLPFGSYFSKSNFQIIEHDLSDPNLCNDVMK